AHTSETASTQHWNFIRMFQIWIQPHPIVYLNSSKLITLCPFLLAPSQSVLISTIPHSMAV
ncbi:hypothetical protein NDU88_006108, partial [Pleurodeles waltl]